MVSHGSWQPHYALDVIRAVIAHAFAHDDSVIFLPGNPARGSAFRVMDQVSSHGLGRVWLVC